MIKMLKYYFKKKWIVLLVLAIASLQITLITTSTSAYTTSWCVDYVLNVWKVEATNPPIVAPTVIACVLATIIPFVEFSFKMKKVNIDQYYSLPIKRDKLYLTTFIFGYLEVIIPVSLSYLVSFLSIYSKPSMFEEIYFLPYYFILLFITLILYTIITFVFTRNNTFVDGLINVILAIFALSMVALALSSIFEAFYIINYKDIYLNGSWYILYSPHTYLSGMFSELLCKGFLTSYKYKTTVAFISLTLFVLIGTLCFYLFVKLSKNDKAENCMQISNSYISYKLMIPLYIVTSFICLRSTSIFVLILISIVAFFMYVLYRRTFKLNKASIITLIVCCVLSFILAIILEEVSLVHVYYVLNIIKGVIL